ncbi:Uncharacterized protein, contains a NRPS condensation (elongation) domain [Paraburkholderia fungorum]|uniref:Phthiocerol/phthiodiolone dimycocerosyl transferase n=1 Tax=Paraburkholderia fungorum TaxID=134537 RepID=A0A1H1JHV7_9BURK|nr:condensation domain-containing protein [Paraburkholderia fungorum]SDR49586.1 Uncharacterized protein, contains a NRPS condensation (elongation) domain [Paraburkholderia fungorum]
MQTHLQEIDGVNEDDQTRVRDLGSTEHLFWLLDQNRPTHFAMVAEIDQVFSREAWQRAFRAAQRRHPLLSTYIGSDERMNTAFYGQPDTEVPLRLVEQSATSWQAEVAREIATPFDWSRAPLLRATILQGEQGSTLILAAHHSVLDGMGGAYLIEDLLLALTGESRSSLQLVHSLEDVLASDMKSAVDLPPAPLAPMPKPFRAGGTETPQIDALALTAQLTQQLIARARIEQTTVHGAMAAAVNEAGRRLSPEWRARPVRTVTPIDVRYLADEVGTANGVYITQTITVADHIDSRSFWHAARKIKRDLSPSQTRATVAAELKALNAAMSARPSVQHAAGFLSAVLAFDVLLSNLGNQPIASSYNGLTLKALWGPIVTSGFADDQIIGLCTIDGMLRLTHVSFAALPGLLDEVRAVLEAAVTA